MNLIERLRADAEATDDIGLCAEAADEIERLRQQLAECERERDAHYDEMQRAWAELKECERERGEWKELAKGIDTQLRTELASATKERDEAVAQELENMASKMRGIEAELLEDRATELRRSA